MCGAHLHVCGHVRVCMCACACTNVCGVCIHTSCVHLCAVMSVIVYVYIGMCDDEISVKVT